jgi:hypothetical protein
LIFSRTFHFAHFGEKWNGSKVSAQPRDSREVCKNQGVSFSSNMPTFCQIWILLPRVEEELVADKQNLARHALICFKKFGGYNNKL